MATLQPFAGGATGVGGVVALRQTYDKDGGLLGEKGTLLDRITRPSVVAGVGGGTLTGLLYWADENRVLDAPIADNSFYATHSLTAITSGAASAAFPVSTSTGGGSSQTVKNTRTMSPVEEKDAGGGSAGGPTNGEFADAE